MPYRTFVDSLGIDWQVWDIVPRLSERRHGQTDRRVEIRPIRFADRRAPEPRRIAETRRSLLRGNFAHGWLCFDSEKEKRRLTPIPTDWTVCATDRLELYARAAEAVRGPHRALDTLYREDQLSDAG